MKKTIRSFAAVLLLGALAFLAGTWPEDAPYRKVVAYDTGAVATTLVCGLFLKKTEDRRNG